MLPGNARVLKCPKCGKKKEVMTLISMHIYESTLWSDSKQDLGKMTPQVSPIQRCPRCGAFYFANRQPWKFGKDCSFEQGRLSYEELKAAVAQFDADGDMTDDEKLTLLPKPCGQATMTNFIWNMMANMTASRNTFGSCTTKETRSRNSASSG